MQTKPKDAPLILSAPMDAEVSIPDSYTDYAAAVVLEAAQLKEVKYGDADRLTLAVSHLKELKSIIKEVEDTEEALRKPINAWLKKVRSVRDTFLAAVTREHLRITGIVNNYQRKALDEKEAREREARAAQAKAEYDARKAEEALSLATSEDAILDAQLALESATLQQEQASAQLAVPTDTPKGLTTKVRFDFEILYAHLCAEKLPGLWMAHDGNETLKMDRAGFLKQLNAASDATAPARLQLLPREGQQTITHTDLGIRIFRDVSVHTR